MTTHPWALVAWAAIVFPAWGQDVVTGAGATFPAPVYRAWGLAYAKERGVDLQFEALGSGAGIERIEAARVDFGATDVPLSAGELERQQLVQFPALIGGVVPVVNVAGIRTDSLKLSGFVLAEIYLGRIKRWNDPQIARLNPDISLPKQGITVVHRGDPSGTTYLWSGYLARSHPEWQSRFGAHPTFDWPAGVKGMGNEGVAAYVQRTRASLGYVEYWYARQHHLSVVCVDQAGNFVRPSRRAFEAAVAAWRWNKGDGRFEPEGIDGRADAWPITAASYVLVRAGPEAASRTRRAIELFDWAFKSGGRIADELDYVPVPAGVISDIETGWARLGWPGRAR